MPRLTSLTLISGQSFRYKNDVTIRGSTHFTPPSPLDIGALQRFFN